MVRGLQSCLLGAAAIGALVALAGCGGRYLFAEREAWRRAAETECISSGAVREGPGKVHVSQIDGPGVCGIDFPLKVSSLGSAAALSFGEEPRPPGGIPNPGGEAPSRWPIGPRPAAPIIRGDGRPLSLDPSADGVYVPPEPYDFRKPFGAQRPIPREHAKEWEPAPVGLSPAATLACPLVSVLDRWIDEDVQPAALKWLGAPVVEIKQISSYACRGMNGDPDATISEHAFGNALDIAAFTLADGRKVDVEHGWHGAPEEQAFLHDVQASACAQFTTVLAPGYNIYHYNHIHVDLMRRRSGRRACQPAPVWGTEVAARLGIPMSARRDLSVTGSLPRVAVSPKPPVRHAATEHKPERDPPVAVPGADGED
jgi:hypothetical protein